MFQDSSTLFHNNKMKTYNYLLLKINNLINGIETQIGN